MVEAIQADAGGAVVAIGSIAESITRISGFLTTVASAVEEQTATTAEMNRSVTEAASGTGEMFRTISGVAQAAQLTSDGIAESSSPPLNWPGCPPTSPHWPPASGTDRLLSAGLRPADRERRS